jgi:23S rRNA pseudouridine2457 synthase
MSKFQYFIFNKPYNVLSQFTKEVPEHITLQDFLTLPSDIYPIGRLDKDSEGLLLLTNDNRFKNRLLDPKYKNPKTYIVQVEGDITDEAIQALKSGVKIKLKKGNYLTQPCNTLKIATPNVGERNPPIRARASIPTSWIEITIEEGKNRQVRKMCAQVGFPCLRLIRTKIKGFEFKDVKQGLYRLLKNDEVNGLKK